MLSADFGNLHRDCRMVNRSAAGWFHLDVMDGIFVPNISFGFPVCKAIAEVAEKPLDQNRFVPIICVSAFPIASLQRSAAIQVCQPSTLRIFFLTNQCEWGRWR